MPALGELLFIDHHVVAQIVETHFVVSAVCDVASVRLLLFSFSLLMDDKPGGQTQKVIDASVLLRAQPRQIFVDSYDMHAQTGQRVEISGQRCHKRLTFTRFHLGDTALMKDDAAHELHFKRTLAQHTPVCLAYQRERVGQYIVKCFARREPSLQFRRHSAQFFVAQRFICVAQRLDLFNVRHDFADLPITVTAEYFL